jgi:two-component system invasion response regulator UvrY
MNQKRLEILIADDHRLFRSGLRELLVEFFDGIGIDEASNGAEILKKAQKKLYDCILLDISLPDQHGIDLIKCLKKSNARNRILILSMYPTHLFGLRAIKAGAAGYLTKDVDPKFLKEAIIAISEGRKFISPALAEILEENFLTRGGKSEYERLTDREIQIMLLISSGKTVTQISRDLYLSVKTVSTHRSNILEKLRMSNNAEMIRYALHHFVVA